MEGRCSVSKKSPGSYSSYQGFLLNYCTSALEPLMAMNDHAERYLRLSVFTVLCGYRCLCSPFLYLDRAHVQQYLRPRLSIHVFSDVYSWLFRQCVFCALWG